MNMDIVASKEDVRTNIRLIKEGKPTPWLIGVVVLELSFDLALAYGAYRALKLLRR